MLPSHPAETSRPTWIRFTVLAGLCAAAALSYVSRNAIAVAESTVRGDLGLTKEQSGWLMSAFFITYSACQIPGAWIGQRFGARRVLPAFAVAWSIATAAGAVSGFLGLIATRIVKGIAQAGLFPVSTGVIATWFPKNGQAFATGALGGCMSVGGAAGAALTGWLVVSIGWRWMFVVYSLPGLLWALWFWIWFRERPVDHPSVNAAERQLIEGSAPAVPTSSSSSPSTASPTPWLALLSSPAVWCICGQQFFRAAGYMFFTSWFATYLQESRGVTIATSGLLTMLPLLAVVGGSFFGGWLSDAVLRRTSSRRLARKGLAIVSLSLCAALTWSAFLFTSAVSAVLIISLGSFFAAIAGPCSYTITIDMGGSHVPTVNSVMNMSGNLGAMLFAPAVPWLLTQTGGWNTVLFCFGALYVAGMLCWVLLRPDGTVFAQAILGQSPEKCQNR